MIIQLNPSIPLNSPKGPCLAHFLIDNGIESDLLWVTFLDKNGECWTWSNKDIRAQKNITEGRDYISPFYDPNEVAFKKPTPIADDAVFPPPWNPYEHPEKTEGWIEFQKRMKENPSYYLGEYDE